MFKIGKYTIKKEDEMQFVLYKDIVISSGKNQGKDGEKFIGYFGYLDMAMSKICNLELLEASNSSDEYLYAEDIHRAIRSLYDMLKEQNHIRPKDM